MKKELLVLLLLLNCFGVAVFAQSKKQINAQLSSQLALEKAKYDSLTIVYNNSLSTLVTARSLAGNTLYKSLGPLNYELEEERHFIRKQLAILQSLNIKEIPASDIYNDKWTNFYTLKFDMENLFGSKFETFEKITPLYLGEVKKIADRNLKMARQIDLYKEASEKLQSGNTAILENKAKLSAFNANSDNIIMEYTNELKRLNEFGNTIQQSLLAAKQEFTKKGPKGYTEAYFKAFPDVFPDKHSDIVPVRSDEPFGTPISYVESDMSASESVAAPPKILDVVEIPAQFPGGRDSLVAFLSSNIQYPEFAFENKIGGKCYVKFIISETGKISDVKIQRGIPDCPECDEEAKRVVKLMPDWKPGINEGKPVSQWYTIPIVFMVPDQK